MSELALYGLPMWSLGGTTTPSTPPPLPSGVTQLSTDPDPITGLMTDHYRSQPSTTGTNAALKRIDRGAESYWTGPSGVQVTHLRPLQPKAVVPGRPGCSRRSHHRARVDRHLHYRSGVRAADRRQLDCRAGAAVCRRRVPGKNPVARLAADAKRTKASAVLVHGQFFSDDTPDAKGAGNQRLFTRVDLDVLRSNATDRAAPRYTPSTRSCCRGRALSRSRPTWSTCPARTPPTLRACWLRSATGHRRRGASSTFVAAPGRTGAAPRQRAARRSSTSCRPSMRRATSRSPRTRASCSQPLRRRRRAGRRRAVAHRDKDRRLVLPVGAAGHRHGGGRRCVSVDRRRPAHALHGPVTLAGDGLHTIEVLGSNGYQATLYVPVDSLPPTVDLDQPGATVPLNGQVPLAFRCGDASSGVATCTATVDGVAWEAGVDVPATTPPWSTR